MPKFSSKSKARLNQCDPRLIKLFERVVEVIDCTVLEGHRDEATQNEYFDSGRSKVEWPQSKHNKRPSLAADVVAYPIDWNDTKKHYYFAGIVMGMADNLGLKIRWGGDWDRDQDLNDQSFMDLVHFELIN